METAFCALAMHEGFIPGNPTLKDPDAACEGLDLPRQTSVRACNYMLKNSSGFGGSNVCLVLRKTGLNEPV
jgi:3-oxoacyl-[acyl-carrier-protein] synthase I